MFRLSRVPSILALLLVSMEFLSAAPAATGNRVSSEPLPEGGVTGTTPVGEGTVRLYIIDPRGEIEGLLLTDGTQLYVTSRAADQLRRAIKPGDRISIYGLREGHETRIRPDVIRNLSTGTTFIVPLRLDLPLQEQAHLSVTEMQATGQIQVLLIHPSKDLVQGFILSDGTQIRLPLDIGDGLRSSFRPGDTLTVRGNGTENEYGRSIEATAMGRHPSQLTVLDASTQRLP